MPKCRCTGDLRPRFGTGRQAGQAGSTGKPFEQLKTMAWLSVMPADGKETGRGTFQRNRIGGTTPVGRQAWPKNAPCLAGRRRNWCGTFGGTCHTMASAPSSSKSGMLPGPGQVRLPVPTSTPTGPCPLRSGRSTSCSCWSRCRTTGPCSFHLGRTPCCRRN